MKRHLLGQHGYFKATVCGIRPVAPVQVAESLKSRAFARLQAQFLKLPLGHRYGQDPMAALGLSLITQVKECQTAQRGAGQDDQSHRGFQEGEA